MSAAACRLQAGPADYPEGMGDAFAEAMAAEEAATAMQAQRAEAVKLFNYAWGLMGLPSRTAKEDDDLVHCAHASRWHWGIVGSAQEWAIGEWQCSRVYAVLGRGEPSLHHAGRCLAICAEHGLDGFIIASAHEAMSRALIVSGDLAGAREHKAKAAAIAAGLDDLEDRAIVEADIASLNC